MVFHMRFLPAFYFVDRHHLSRDGQRPGIARTPEQLPARPQWQDRLLPEVSAGAAERVLGSDLPYAISRHSLQQLQQIALYAGYWVGEDARVYLEYWLSVSSHEMSCLPGN